MNVLHLTTHLDMGGITQYILRLIKPMKKRGVQIFVASGGGSLKSHLETEGATVFDFPIRTKSELHPKLYFAIPKLIQFLRREKINLIHAHTRVTQVLAFWLSLFTGIPVVTTCHGFYKQRLGRKILPAWGKCVIAISDGVSDFLADDFHVPKNKISLIYNAVNIEEMDKALANKNKNDLKAHFGFSPQDQVIGVVARLVKDKGHEILIRSLKDLSLRHPHLKLLIAGEGREKSFLQQLAQSLEMENRIFFSGTLTDISEALITLDLFVLPATWREGFGLSIVEAMVAHKPVIVTNVWALNTLVRNEETGLLIPPSDVLALSQAIERLLEDKTLASKLAKQGRQMAVELFGIEHFADLVHQTYQKIISPPIAP